jgi:hypothetical protein
VDETEQLDYEEDEEEKKPRDKFESEKKRETGNDESNQVDLLNKSMVNALFRSRALSVLLIPNFKIGYRVRFKEV